MFNRRFRFALGSRDDASTARSVIRCSLHSSSASVLANSPYDPETQTEDGTQDHGEPPDEDEDAIPADKTRIETNPLERLEELNAAVRRSSPGTLVPPGSITNGPMPQICVMLTATAWNRPSDRVKPSTLRDDLIFSALAIAPRFRLQLG